MAPMTDKMDALSAPDIRKERLQTLRKQPPAANFGKTVKRLAVVSQDRAVSPARRHPMQGEDRMKPVSCISSIRRPDPRHASKITVPVRMPEAPIRDSQDTKGNK